MTTYKRKIYFIIGPTASGKTALSVDLAKKNGNAEIISADSRQIYHDLNISSGKVTKVEMANIPHHMLDVVNPGQYFSVVDFTNMALQKIEEIYSRGNTPIICGGTGFYIDSLLYKYNLPETTKNDQLRKNLENKNAKELFTILLKKLFKVKNIKYLFKNISTIKKFSVPEYKNNPHRLMRAIEIVEALGYIPELKKEKRFSDSEYEINIISTNVDRKTLREKIKYRTVERLENGMLEEIVEVKTKYHLSDDYIKSLGYEYSLCLDLIQKTISKEKFLEEFVNKEMQYAKRQESWFKRYKNTIL